MDYIQGRKITTLSPLSQLELDGHSLAEELFAAYLKQVLVDGIFHADPHPGNVFLTEDNRIALLDLGMVGRTTPAMQEHLLKLLLAIAEKDPETAATVVIGISQAREDFDRLEFVRLVRQVMAVQQEGGLQQMNIGRSLLNVSRSAADNGLFIPSELALLGKTLLQLDEVGKIPIRSLIQTRPCATTCLDSSRNECARARRARVCSVRSSAQSSSCPCCRLICRE